MIKYNVYKKELPSIWQRIKNFSLFRKVKKEITLKTTIDKYNSIDDVLQYNVLGGIKSFRGFIKLEFAPSRSAPTSKIAIFVSYIRSSDRLPQLRFVGYAYYGIPFEVSIQRTNNKSRFGVSLIDGDSPYTTTFNNSSSFKNYCWFLYPVIRSANVKSIQTYYLR
jgi:hypothetical protein